MKPALIVAIYVIHGRGFKESIPCKFFDVFLADPAPLLCLHSLAWYKDIDNPKTPFPNKCKSVQSTENMSISRRHPKDNPYSTPNHVLKYSQLFGPTGPPSSQSSNTGHRPQGASVKELTYGSGSPSRFVGSD